MYAIRALFNNVDVLGISDYSPKPLTGEGQWGALWSKGGQKVHQLGFEACNGGDPELQRGALGVSPACFSCMCTAPVCLHHH
jgi:hypothetical protein